MASSDGRPIDPLWVGIQKHGAGWRAIVSRGRTRPPVTRHFERHTDPREMQAWRAREQAKAVLRQPRAFAGTFAHDARKYLQSVSALPTIADRRREIGLWMAAFGARRRELITSADIRGVRDQWMTARRSPKDARPVAAGTINKRLRALSNMYAVLDGRRAENPVRDVPELREPAPEARTLTYTDIAKIIAALPDIDRAPKGQKRRPVSITKIRLRCLAYCQITPKQLTLIQPHDLDLEGKRLRLPARLKGRGAKAIWTELTPEAVAAFRDFDQHQGYGTFSRSGLRKSFKSAAKRAGIPTIGLRPYDLRHAYGALAFRALNGNLDAVGKLMQHTVRSTTERYVLAAETQVMAELGARVVEHFVDRPNGSTAPYESANSRLNQSSAEPPATDDAAAPDPDIRSKQALKR